MSDDDLSLLREYSRRNSEEAFATLVSRHVNLVYSVALRQVRDTHLAEEITQAVFIILARKADSLSPKTILPGWLCRTAQYVSANALTIERRRRNREQEAYMQSRVSETELDAWPEIAPLLDGAMNRLNQKDHDALVLRFFESKNFREVGAALGASEDAAKVRVNRALEKLRKFFTKRGVSSTTAIIAGAISANSVQAAPAALAKTVTVTAIAKGAAASSSTLTLIKGALKLMAWTKTKMAIAVGVGLLLAAGTTTVAIKEIREYRTYPWQVESFKNPQVDIPTLLAKTPPQVHILRSKFSHWAENTPFTIGDSTDTLADGTIIIHTNQSQSIGLGAPFDSIVNAGFGGEDRRRVILTKLPEGRFDYIANLPQGALPALQEEIKKKFGLVGRREMRETDVLLLQLSSRGSGGFKPANSLRRSLNVTDTNTHSVFKLLRDGSYFAEFDHTFDEGFFRNFRSLLEDEFQLPILDRTGLTNRYDFTMTWAALHNNDKEDHRRIIRDELLDQLGLELVPSREPIEMVVIDKAK